MSVQVINAISFLKTKRVFRIHINSQKTFSLWIADSFCFLFNLDSNLRKYLTYTVKVNMIRQNSKAYSEPCQTSKMEHFANIFSRRSILDLRQGSEFVSEIWKSLRNRHESATKHVTQPVLYLPKWTIETPEQYVKSVFKVNNKKTEDVNFERIWQIILVFPLLTLNK